MPEPEITLRHATFSDLDSITDLALAALPDDPVWPYRFPDAGKYPDEHRHYTRLRFSEYLASQEAGFHEIFLAAIGDTVIAMAIWKLCGDHLPSPDHNHSPSDRYERPDGSALRMEAFREKLNESQTTWFDKQYGDNQLQLALLCTSRDHRRRGAATKLVQWGLTKVKSENLTLTLFSSPLGKYVYLKLGFRQVGLDKAQVVDDQDSVDILGMVYDSSRV